MFQVLTLLMGLFTRALKPDSLDPDSLNPDPDPVIDTVAGSRPATHIALLIWIPRTATQHCIMQLKYGLRPCGGKVVFGSGYLICIGSGFKVRVESPNVEHH